MSDIAIDVKNLSKLYQLGEIQYYRTLRESISNFFKRSFKKNKNNGNYIWALKDVSFEIKKGEVVGIIGSNGAGKTTLLKILSRITPPTTGYAWVKGRVGILLAVGTGFHPELTGRENIYLSGAILGMKKKEIQKKFDEIVAFAEVEKFIDTPVKHYSSGMYVRLAFAVAAHLEPDILLVDEVLAVGDINFQKKSLGKMDAVAKSGRTVLFVSHNMAAVNHLCQKTLWLDKGKIRMFGPTETIIGAYLLEGVEIIGERQWKNLAESPGNDKVRLKAVRILNNEGKLSASLDMRFPFFIEIEYQLLCPVSDLQVGFSILTSEGKVIFSTGDRADLEWQGKARAPGIYKSVCEIPAHILNAGKYIISVGGDIRFEQVFVFDDRCLCFYIEQTEHLPYSLGRPAGVICPPHKWHIYKIS